MPQNEHYKNFKNIHSGCSLVYSRETYEYFIYLMKFLNHDKFLVNPFNETSCTIDFLPDGAIGYN